MKKEEIKRDAGFVWCPYFPLFTIEYNTFKSIFERHYRRFYDIQSSVESRYTKKII